VSARRIEFVLIVAAAITALALTACASSSSDDGTPPAPTAEEQQRPAGDAEFADAVSNYRAYLDKQAAGLVAATASLRDAIAAGDLDASRAAYIAARPWYERIAAAAEYIPVSREIDPQILHGPVDATVGFHKIEHGLWVDNTTAGLAETADKLAADAATLQQQLPALEMDHLRMTEAYELLDRNPINSRFQMEPYSSSDLNAQQAHVDGSRVVFDALRPAISARLPQLATDIEGAFASVDTALQPFRRGDAFVTYSSLTQDDRRNLSIPFDHLSELLSRVKIIIQQPLP
jgi:iron uptake system component EfeO